MDLYSHLKTPKMINERQDGVCPFCLTELKYEAFVCAACGAHKWHIKGTRVSRAQFRNTILLTILVIFGSFFIGNVINFLEVQLTPELGDMVWIIKPVIYIFYGYWILNWLAHIFEFIESFRTNGGKINGTVWRRRRW